MCHPSSNLCEICRSQLPNSDFSHIVSLCWVFWCPTQRHRLRILFLRCPSCWSFFFGLLYRDLFPFPSCSPFLGRLFPTTPAWVLGTVCCVSGGCVIMCGMEENVLKMFSEANCSGGEARLKKLAESGEICELRMFAYDSHCAKPRGGNVFVFVFGEWVFEFWSIVGWMWIG